MTTVTPGVSVGKLWCDHVIIIWSSEMNIWIILPNTFRHIHDINNYTTLDKLRLSSSAFPVQSNFDYLFSWGTTADGLVDINDPRTKLNNLEKSKWNSLSKGPNLSQSDLSEMHSIIVALPVSTKYIQIQ